MQRNELVAYLDEYLRIKSIDDISDNGLQVEGIDEVRRLAFAVDAGRAAFEATCAAGAQMLVVHHGLSWGKPVPVTGIHRRRLALLLEANISLYAVHLPLDLHDEVGNNATLARWLKLQDVSNFGDFGGQPAGVTGRLPAVSSLGAFEEQVERVLGEPVVQVWPFGEEAVQQVAVASGRAASLVDLAAKAGADVYLTGEMDHSAYHEAQELGLNVVFAGHYATETAGLKALAEHLASRYELECVFLDLPTGA